MMPNTHPTTGIRYTVYSMHSINLDVSHELWYGSQAVDTTYEKAYAQALATATKEARWAALDSGDDFDEEAFKEYWECPDLDIDEHDVSGTYEGVRYEILWLGGSPLLWILESPHTQDFALCSPCCPQACDGDSPTSVGFTGYAVPAEWLVAE